MKHFIWPALLTFAAIPAVFSSPHSERALPVPAPAGLPSLNDIIAHAKSRPGGACCAALSYVLGPKIVYPVSVAYIGTAASFWSAQEQSVVPNCVVEPTLTKHVSAAIFVLSALSAYTKFSDECKFGIRSGGHTPQRAGVTIDLGAFKQVDVSADRKKTSIGPGNRWADVYTKLDAQGLAVPGGRFGTVGVGGLVTGGGVSFFSGRYGFVCDSVVNYELVLPYGKVVNVNALSSPDLFKALKGGSNNFGVVTRFDIKSFESGRFWGGEIIYPISTMPQQISAFVGLGTCEHPPSFAKDSTSAKPYDQYAALIHNYAFKAGEWFILNNYEYTKILAQPYPPVFKPFTDIQPQTLNTMRVSNLTDFIIELATGSPPGKRALFITFSHGLSAALLTQIYRIADTALQPIKLVPGLVYSLTFQPLPTAITTKAANANSLGLDASDGNLVLTLLTISWVSPTDDVAVTAAANTWLKAAKAASVKAGLSNEHVYLNYAAPGQDPIAGYGAANKAALRRVSRKYDLDQIFQKAVPGAFKL
ncbi:MAG: hypothetical protein L6R40_002369 [Gallowayella cf. fulva]|nr:MAG: hypothetical protein L6R40_002369 [Xanthomendoza cf. fulva]